MGLSRQTLRHPVLVLIFFALLGSLGLFTFNKLALALFPETENPFVMVMTTYPNAGPESVETTITQPVDSALVSLNGLKSMFSQSSEGSSTVSLEFEYGTDLDVVVSDIREKLERVSRGLPDNASSPSIMRFNGNSSSVMRILVRGNRSVNDLKLIAENTIADVLEQADGVGEADVSGGRTAQVMVEVSQNRLEAYGFTVSTIASALSRQNLELGGGKLTDGNRNYIVRTTGEYTSLDQINNTVISTINGYDVKLSDVGNAYLGYAEATREAYINGEPGVYISITKQSDANTVNVANGVYKKIDQLKTLLPPDITMEIIADDTVSIRETINTLVESAWMGLVLAVFILFIFLQNFKSTIIISISIPLSIIITLFCMNMFGITLNMMTLTGLILGVGMIVDASIVMIDNIYSYRQRGARPKIAAILGSEEMLMSVVSGNLTTICVFIPFLFFTKELGMMGQMFKGIIFTIVISLVSSLVVAIFLVPVLAGKFLPLSNREEKPVKSRFLKGLYGFFQKIIDFFTNIYSKMLKVALRNKLITISIAVSLLAIAFSFIPTMQLNLMPMGRSDSIRLSMNLPIGTPMSETKRILLEMEDFINKEVTGFDSITTTIGGGGRNGSSSHRGTIELTLTDDANSMEMENKIRTQFEKYPGAQFYFRGGFRSQMMGDDIDIAIRSKDLDIALDVANQIMDVISTLPSCSEPTIDTEEGLPQVEIVIDRERAYTFGVDVSTVASEINAAINGKSAGTYRKDGNEYSVVVSYRPEDRQTVDDLDSIYVRGSKGMVSVANFATVKKGYGPVTIRRDNRTRIIHVKTNILTQDNANVIEKQIQDAINNTFIIPDSVSVSYEGSWQDTTSQMKLYLKIVAMAIILVFGVMAATYESFKAPLINLLTIPFIVIGVTFLYKITGQPISLMAMVGLIMLVGIVVNNGIILVDYTNLLVGRGVPLMDACWQAGVSRFRPVLMTTLTTILGMLPMCFATEGQALLVQPIGIAVVGGLTSSTFVTLFVIPVIYSVVMKQKATKTSNIQIKYEE